MKTKEALTKCHLNRRTFYAEMIAIVMKCTRFFTNQTQPQPPSLLLPKSRNS